MKVTLMGLEFFINNLGCEALSYSFVSELNKIVEQLGEELDISTIVFADKKTAYIPGTDIAIKNIGIHYKKPDFWRKVKKEFRESDMIFDFTMGDSFSDIYGKKRFFLDALVKLTAVKSGTPYILGPQTYGPYYSKAVKRTAKRILNGAYKVYARDEKSQHLVEELIKSEVGLSTDIAFALPYIKQDIQGSDKIRVAFNPSGLLWAGGYNGKNQFNLSIDYQEYCSKICEFLASDSKYDVFLIPHVGTSSASSTSCENDLGVCMELQRRFPAFHVFSNINTPMDIKGFIAAMDVFIGARMHATIGAFSAGVATIPVSYSRKFEGLYGSIDYPYVIHACESSNDEAINTTIDYIKNYSELKNAVDNSMRIVNNKQDVFRKSISELIKELLKK